MLERYDLEIGDLRFSYLIELMIGMSVQSVEFVQKNTILAHSLSSELTTPRPKAFSFVRLISNMWSSFDPLE